MRVEKLLSNFLKYRRSLAELEKISGDMMGCIVTDRAVGTGGYNCLQIFEHRGRDSCVVTVVTIK
jgi:hypothetical protein